MSGALHFARRIVVIGSMVVIGGGAVSGRTPGDPIPDIDVTVEQHPGPRLQTHTDANGTFSLTLPAGTYVVHIGSRPAPSGAPTRASAVRPGEANGRVIPLPDAAPGGGAFPYVLRLAGADVAIKRVGYAVAAVASPNQRSAAATGRDLEVTIAVGNGTARAGATFTLRGSVDSVKSRSCMRSSC